MVQILIDEPNTNKKVCHYQPDYLKPYKVLFNFQKPFLYLLRYSNKYFCLNL